MARNAGPPANGKAVFKFLSQFQDTPSLISRTRMVSSAGFERKQLWLPSEANPNEATASHSINATL
jgi:hypothetical protein